MKQEQKAIDLNLAKLAEGALQEQYELEMGKVLERLHDPNVDISKKAKVVITLECVINDKRDVINMGHGIKTTLPPLLSGGTTLITGKEVETGRVEARELKSGIPNQAFMNVETGEVLDHTGEPVVVEVTEETMSKVIDLQANRA